MPEWLLIVIAIAGIFLIGLFFSAIDLVKDFARIVFISLFVFLLILVANRILAPGEPDPNFGQNNYPPDAEFIEPIEPNGSQVEPYVGDGSNACVSDYLRNLSEDIDEFVFGSENRYGQQPPDANDNSISDTRATGQNELIYIFPEDSLEENQNVDQPINQTPARSTGTRSGTRATGSSGGVPAMW